jgi:prolipoprotein diacylglyceryl transferase
VRLAPASIPSPSTGEIAVGPVVLHAYGLILLLGIVAAVWLSGVRWTRRGGDWDLVFRAALWGVAFGIVGARLYHLATSWESVPDEWWGPFAIWEGGLGIWGAIPAGALAAAVIVRRAGVSASEFADAGAPGVLLAQAIGRWGNYFNQELFGRPTDLPWALEIDPENRPEAYAESDTFHPTFLYESLWNLLGVGVLLFVDRRFRIRPPGIFALYVAWYTFGRFFIELLRIDEPTPRVAGMRWNAWVAIVVFLAAVAAFIWTQRRGRERRGPLEPVKRRPSMAVPRGRVRRRG